MITIRAEVISFAFGQRAAFFCKIKIPCYDRDREESLSKKNDWPSKIVLTLRTILRQIAISVLFLDSSTPVSHSNHSRSFCACAWDSTLTYRTEHSLVFTLEIHYTIIVIGTEQDGERKKRLRRRK